ncbi:MAG: elongation factor P [Patescibacteria group bacterium]|nr:elongation factor P [Patescibacteria group bacterium]
MLSYSELKRKSRIIIDKEPYEIIEANSTVKARGSSVLQTKLRNLKTGNVVSKTFHPSDSLEEPEISKLEVKFIYSHKDKFVFTKKDNPSERFELTAGQIGEQVIFLTQNSIVEALVFNNEVINISLPIKVNLRVKEAPPSVKGESQSGNKSVVLETGAKITVPSFIKTGDVVEVNTESKEYVRRIE